MKPSDKKKVRECREMLQRWQHGQLAPPISMAEQSERKARAKADYGYFVRTYFSHLAPSACAPWQIEAANRVLHNPDAREVWEVFRGGAKSMHANTFLALWLMIHGQMHYMLLQCATNELAQQYLSTTKKELESNPIFIQDYGPQKGAQWEDDYFITEGGIIFRGFGANQKPRGTRAGAYRPDYIVVDDYDDENSSRNPHQLDKKEDHLTHSVFATKGAGDNCRIIISNNGPFEDMIVKRFAKRKGWNHVRVNVLTHDGKSAWPAKLNLKRIQEEREEMGERAWQAEKMNTPMPLHQCFKPEWIRWHQPRAYDQYEALVMYIDPGTSDSKRADHKAMCLWGLALPTATNRQKNAQYHKLMAVNRRCSQMEFWNLVFELYKEIPVGISRNMYVYMEGGGVRGNQSEMIPHIIDDAAARGIDFKLQKDPRPTNKKGQKESRIVRMALYWEQFRVYYSSTKKNDPDMLTGIQQLLTFNPRNPNNVDDGPDADEGALYHLSKMDRPKIGRVPQRRTSERRKRHAI